MSVDPFITHRRLLFTVAYEMLGSAADAEDVVQETWLRWAAVDQSEVQDRRARTSSAPSSHSTGSGRSAAGVRSMSASGCPGPCSPVRT
jgi:sigma-70-like protein